MSDVAVTVVGENGARLPGVEGYEVLPSGVLKVWTRKLGMPVTTHYAPAAWIKVRAEGLVSTPEVMSEWSSIPTTPTL